MRLVLTGAGRTILDVEVLLWRKTETSTDDGPKLRASGGGQVERAEVYGGPETTASFGFVR